MINMEQEQFYSRLDSVVDANTGEFKLNAIGVLETLRSVISGEQTGLENLKESVIREFSDLSENEFKGNLFAYLDETSLDCIKYSTLTQNDSFQDLWPVVKEARVYSRFSAFFDETIIEYNKDMNENPTPEQKKVLDDYVQITGDQNAHLAVNFYDVMCTLDALRENMEGRTYVGCLNKQLLGDLKVATAIASAGMMSGLDLPPKEEETLLLKFVSLYKKEVKARCDSTIESLKSNNPEADDNPGGYVWVSGQSP
ncbi:MAG: hypothetical protein Q8O89_01445 [Nanoarchaeota archaeon]|nr:hypothetical protein [Nanoarchaeota archaeon]